MARGGNMIYETMDWKLEAKRVARAFGVSEECSFQEHTFYDYWTDPPKHFVCRDLLWASDNLTPVIIEGEARFFRCEYRKNQGRWYHAFLDARTASESITIDWNGRVPSWVTTRRLPQFFAKGLYHLSLLTPEVEFDLNILVSEHEKLEWKLDYEERYGL